MCLWPRRDYSQARYRSLLEDLLRLPGLHRSLLETRQTLGAGTPNKKTFHERGVGMKRQLLSLTRTDLLDLLLAVQGELYWLETYDSLSRKSRYKKLEKQLVQRLENLEVEERVA
jgi:hypothetical protein